MKTIYISGPITDNETGKPFEGWKKGFLDAESKLRWLGFRVINPVDIALDVEEAMQYKREYYTAECVPESAEPTRADYIMECLRRMKMYHDQNHLHGLYVIGNTSFKELAKTRIYYSLGVQMELRMAKVLNIPVFAEFYGGNEIDINLLPVKDGQRLTEKGEFGKEDWSKFV